MTKARSRMILAIVLVLALAVITAGAAMAADRGPWAPNTSYAVNDTVTYMGNTYKCLQAHTSLTGWEPSNVPALWQLVSGTPPPTTPPPTTPPPTTPPPTTPPPNANLALNRPATGSASCNTNEGPAKAVNGSVSGGNSDKFCSTATTKWLQVDLGSSRMVAQFAVRHAGAGGESTSFNTRAFNIQTSTDNVNWTTVVTVTANTANSSVHNIPVRNARYVRLNITQPQQTTGGAARIYELEVYAGTVPPTTPPPTTPPPTTPPPTTPPPVTGRMFAPYLDISPGPNSTIGNLAGNRNSVSRMYTLAFILGRGCSASWFGTFEMNTQEANDWVTRINELRAVGGDVIIAFGGAAAPELANVCPSVSALQAQYQAVVTKYNLRYLDMDIEDFSPAAIDMRNKALTGLLAANPNLKLHYTLGVLPTGMTNAQISVLENARTNGTRVDVVNIMAMDYYQNVQDMGAAAIQAAQATRTQLNNLGFTNTKIGITPMIGRNDSPETFTLEDAQQVRDWAVNNGIVLLAFWSVGRDNGGCPNGTVSPSCSGIAQSQFQFSSIFRSFMP